MNDQPLRRDVVGVIGMVVVVGLISVVMATRVGLDFSKASSSQEESFAGVAALVAAQEALLVDVAPEPRQRQLPGAMRVEPETLEGSAQVVAAASHGNQPVVVYGGNVGDPANDGVAEMLLEMGVADVRIYRGGLEEWSEQGGKLEWTH